MLTLTQRCPVPPTPAVDTAVEVLALPFELRQRSRFRARLTDGTEVGVILPRGQILRGGNYLKAEQGLIVRIEAAPEPVSEAFSTDPLQLQRACYHLGNRHVPLQIGNGWLRYGHDHVLDAMVEGLGLTLRFAQAPFEPEAGAYGGHGHDTQHEH